MNPQLQAALQQVIQAFQDGNFNKANLILREVLQKNINNADTIFELGVTYAKANRLKEAFAIFFLLQSYKNDDVRIQYNLGLMYSLQGKHQLALDAYDVALKINPDDVDTLVNKGVTCIEINNYGLALETLNRAIQLRPDIPEAWSNKGIALNNLNLYLDSISAYNEAIKLAPNYHEAWSNKSVPLNKLKRFFEASEACDIALKLKPDYAQAWFNKGLTLHELKRFEEALVQYDKALNLKPDYAQAWFNKGLTLHELKRFEEAIVQYDKALNLKLDCAEAWSNKGAALHELKRFDEALVQYDKALSLKPNIDWLWGDLLHTKMKICDWSGLTGLLENCFNKVAVNEKASTPFALLALSDDAFLHKKCSETYAKANYPSNQTLGSIPKSLIKDKIRIAYFSPDFHSHPVAYLTSELFELHDRERFEVIAFSLRQAHVGDEMNKRLRKGFDRFIDVDDMSDQEIAQLTRDLEIDIAIDLAGPTQHSRTGIFSYRAAPIQVNWLGYPGTIGSDFIDYIVADKIVIPEPHQEFYTEKIAFLPNTYMVDDSKRLASSRIFTRKECGLPSNAFVFCCFNNDYKFNPQVLDCWAKILLTVKNSVFWISKNNERFSTNLLTEFKHRGIDNDRIIFAPRVDLMEDHLARYALADLFLDTFPYNAHTTAIDSLKAGVPILTLIGQSFDSRVAASLLNAIDLPELITNTRDEYEALAIELAMNRQKFMDIRLRLANNRLTTPLFDTPLFTKNLEAAYIKMMERYQTGLDPEHISIT